MKNRFVLVIIACIFGFMMIKSCNKSSNATSTRTYEKTPVDKIIVELSAEQNYSILLADMDSKGTDYFHKYKTLIEKPDTVLVRDSDWEKVSDVFFDANINNLGMAIATKKDGKLSKVASPAGYNNFIGNEKYGQWKERDGYSFWEFYGQYAFMSAIFNMATYPVRRSYWDDYYRGGYYGSRPYYGPSGNMYGTRSYTSKNSSGGNTNWANKPSSFKNDVRRKVSRSAQQTKTRRARNTSRYSRSSSRSRGGGFGK
jgi:hypothetical protein